MAEQHAIAEAVSPRLKAKKVYRRLKRGVPSGEDVSYLNITAMMDMMTIILVFFLKSFSTSVENIPVGEDLMPPKSNSQVKPHQAVQITVTKKAILVEDEAVAAVKRGAVDSSIKKDGQSGYQINPLFTNLQKHATRLKKIEKMTGGKMKFSGEVVLIADHGTPLPADQRGALHGWPGRVREVPAAGAEGRSLARLRPWVDGHGG